MSYSLLLAFVRWVKEWISQHPDSESKYKTTVHAASHMAKSLFLRRFVHLLRWFARSLV